MKKNSSQPILSIVVPCYNEQEALVPFMEEIQRVIPLLGDDVQVELILVNDGSRDNTLAILRELAEKHDYVRYASFSRNFGKEAAILAGLSLAKGRVRCCDGCGFAESSRSAAGHAQGCARGRLRLRRHLPHHPQGRASHPFFLR